MAQSTARFVGPKTSSDLTRRTTSGVLLGILLLLIARALVDAAGIDVGVTEAMSPFEPGPLILTTIVAGAGAAIAYAALDRLTAEPMRNFLGLAALVFVLMLAPVFGAPPEGITTAGQAILVAYHAIVAVSLVGFITGLVDI